MPAFVSALTVGALVWLLAGPGPQRPARFRYTELMRPGASGPNDSSHGARGLLSWPGRGGPPGGQLGRDLLLSGAAISLTNLYRLKALSMLAAILPAGLVFTGGDVLIGLLLIFCVPLAWHLPGARISGRARQVRREITRELPGFLHAMAVMIEAGMNLYPALQTYARTDQTELGAKLRLAIAEVELGSPLAAALIRMAARCQVDDLFQIVAAIIQATERGTGLAGTCRDLAAAAWNRRKDAARELGQQAAAKMLLPLLLLVLPSLFLFMLGPAIYNLLWHF